MQILSPFLEDIFLLYPAWKYYHKNDNIITKQKNGDINNWRNRWKIWSKNKAHSVVWRYYLKEMWNAHRGYEYDVLRRLGEKLIWDGRCWYKRVEGGGEEGGRGELRRRTGKKGEGRESSGKFDLENILSVKFSNAEFIWAKVGSVVYRAKPS